MDAEVVQLKEHVDVLVIGAGPAGLVTSAACRHSGLKVLVLDRAQAVGGWACAHNASNRATGAPSALQLSDAMFKSRMPIEPKVQDARSYLASYAAFWGLPDHVRLSCRLTSLAAADPAAGARGRWHATFQDLVLGRHYQVTADFVVMCTGHHLPEGGGKDIWPGQVTAGVRRLHAYQATVEDVASCQGTVAVVGDGEAAVDVASSLALLREGRGVRLVLLRQIPAPSPSAPASPGAVAAALASENPRVVDGASLLDSARRRALAAALQPHYSSPTPGAVGRALIAPTKRRFWALLKGKAAAAVSADKRAQPSGHSANGSAPPQDGGAYPTEAPAAPQQKIQLLLWAPSFSDPRVMPFLDSSLRQALLRGGNPGSAGGSMSRDLLLYRGIVHPEVPVLGFVGYGGHSSTSLSVLELQAQWLVAHLTSRLQLPSPAAMRAEVEASRAWRAAALASPLMSTHGSLAARHERRYEQQLLADLHGIVELKPPKEGGEWRIPFTHVGRKASSANRTGAGDGSVTPARSQVNNTPASPPLECTNPSAPPAPATAAPASAGQRPSSAASSNFVTDCGTATADSGGGRSTGRSTSSFGGKFYFRLSLRPSFRTSATSNPSSPPQHPAQPFAGEQELFRRHTLAGGWPSRRTARAHDAAPQRGSTGMVPTAPSCPEGESTPGSVRDTSGAAVAGGQMACGGAHTEEPSEVATVQGYDGRETRSSRSTTGRSTPTVAAMEAGGSTPVFGSSAANTLAGRSPWGEKPQSPSQTLTAGGVPEASAIPMFSSSQESATGPSAGQQTASARAMSRLGSPVARADTCQVEEEAGREDRRSSGRSLPLGKLLQPLERFVSGKALDLGGGSAAPAQATCKAPASQVQYPTKLPSGDGGSNGGTRMRGPPRRSFSYSSGMPVPQGVAIAGVREDSTRLDASSRRPRWRSQQLLKISLQRASKLKMMTSPFSTGLVIGGGNASQASGGGASGAVGILSPFTALCAPPGVDSAVDALEWQLAALRTHLQNPDQVPFPAVTSPPSGAATSSSALHTAREALAASPSPFDSSTVPVCKTSPVQHLAPLRVVNSSSLFSADPAGPGSVSAAVVATAGTELWSPLRLSRRSMPDLPDREGRMLPILEEKTHAADSPDKVVRPPLAPAAGSGKGALAGCATATLKSESQSSQALDGKEGTGAPGVGAAAAGSLRKPPRRSLTASSLLGRGGGAADTRASSKASSTSAAEAITPLDQGATDVPAAAVTSGIAIVAVGESHAAVGSPAVTQPGAAQAQQPLPSTAPAAAAASPRLSSKLHRVSLSAAEIRERASASAKAALANAIAGTEALFTRLSLPRSNGPSSSPAGVSPQRANTGSRAAAANGNPGAAVSEPPPAGLAPVAGSRLARLASPAVSDVNAPSGTTSRGDTTPASGLSAKLLTVLAFGSQARASPVPSQSATVGSPLAVATGTGGSGTATPCSIPLTKSSRAIIGGRPLAAPSTGIVVGSAGSHSATSLGRSLGGLLGGAADAAQLPYSQRVQEPAIAPAGSTPYSGGHSLASTSVWPAGGPQPAGRQLPTSSLAARSVPSAGLLARHAAGMHALPPPIRFGGAAASCVQLGTSTLGASGAGASAPLFMISARRSVDEGCEIQPWAVIGTAGESATSTPRQLHVPAGRLALQATHASTASQMEGDVTGTTSHDGLFFMDFTATTTAQDVVGELPARGGGGRSVVSRHGGAHGASRLHSASHSGSVGVGGGISVSGVAAAPAGKSVHGPHGSPAVSACRSPQAPSLPGPAQRTVSDPCGSSGGSGDGVDGQAASAAVGTADDRQGPARSVMLASQARQAQLVDAIASRLRGAVAKRAVRQPDAPGPEPGADDQLGAMATAALQQQQAAAPVVPQPRHGPGRSQTPTCLYTSGGTMPPLAAAAGAAMTLPPPAEAAAAPGTQLRRVPSKGVSLGAMEWRQRLPDESASGDGEAVTMQVA